MRSAIYFLSTLCFAVATVGGTVITKRHVDRVLRDMSTITGGYRFLLGKCTSEFDPAAEFNQAGLSILPAFPDLLVGTGDGMIGILSCTRNHTPITVPQAEQIFKVASGTYVPSVFQSLAALGNIIPILEKITTPNVTRLIKESLDTLMHYTLVYDDTLVEAAPAEMRGNLRAIVKGIDEEFLRVIGLFRLV